MKKTIEYYSETGLEITKAHDDDAGFDLRTPVPFILPSHSYWVVDTGIHVDIPKGYAGLIVSKSGLNVKHSIMSTGLIDSGYTGSIVVKLYNFGMDDYEFGEGDKISQLMILPIFRGNSKKIKMINRNTSRGSNGFGSSGRK